MNKQITIVTIALMTFVATGIGYWLYMRTYHNQFLTSGSFMQNDSMACSGMDRQGQSFQDHGGNKVVKKVLDNGMTILVHSMHGIPKVSLQIWYNVGSKDEETGEKGIAHLIEHMIFKGTTGEGSLNLSESDINTLSHTLSARSNAFTAQDFTGYLFDIPTQNWTEVLPVMADCMVNCAFKDDHLNSEMKAVIQELKMRKDNYQLSLAEELMTTIFADHPYHYPIIGYKQDLWSVHGHNLHAFYKKHYWPNNATLVVVGDVNPQDVFAQAEKYFGHIPANYEYKKHEFYYNKDISSKEVTIYRDVAQPFEMVAYVIPGASSKKKPIIDIASLILGMGKGSRLYKKIVDEQQLATSLYCFYWDILFDYSLLFIAFEPKKLADSDKIITIIHDEIDDIVKNGVNEHELTRAVKQARMDYYNTLEDVQQQAYDIGKFYLATGDENFIYHYLDESNDELQKQIREMFAEYLRPSVMHLGKILPLPESEKQTWANLQKLSDAEDTRFLATRPRSTPVEPASYAKTIHAKEISKFDFPKAHELMLENGLKVLYYDNPNTPKINIEIRLKAQSYYEPAAMSGIYSFMMGMLNEGTEHYTAAQLADELESRGMSFSASPGYLAMTMLSSDLKKGLELLVEMLTKATFTESEIEKVREQIFAEIKNFWDNPSAFGGQIIKEHIYKGHPYSKNLIGTKESIAAIDRNHLIELYKAFVTPVQATMAIVGDLQGQNLKKVLEETIGTWKGPEVKSIEFPQLAKPAQIDVNYPINRDQVQLSLVGLSVDRKDPDYDKLLIFDQILGSGVLGSMKSRLFKLREQSGLFYSISGSLIAQANEQPGMVMVKTLVSVDRLKEAEEAIKKTLSTVADDISKQEVSEAKSAILNSLALNFETNASMSSAFLFLDKYGLTSSYFDNRAAKLMSITIPEIQDAVKRVLHTDQLLVFRIGRVDSPKTK